MFSSNGLRKRASNKTVDARRAMCASVASVCEQLESRRLMTVSFNLGPVLAADAPAAQAANDVAAWFSSLFTDAPTVSIDLELANLGANVLAQAGSERAAYAYADVRSGLIADRAADESVVASLPTGIAYNIPAGFTINAGVVDVSRASAKSLDFTLWDSPPSAYNPAVTDRDAFITFNTDFFYDVDPSNGITAGQYDFTGILAHEVGHALGFTSAVDVFDANSSGLVYPQLADLFRIAPGSGGSFSSAARELRPNVAAALYDGGVFNPSSVGISGYGVGEIPMSTGRSKGDGRQASHWKDDALSGAYLGAEDPTLAPGTFINWLSTDTRALGLIGWNVSPTAPQLTPDGLLSINGSSAGDSITLAVANGVMAVTVNGVVTRFWAGAVSRVSINGNDGNDTISAASVAVPVTIYGGNGNDTLVGGAASDSLFGEAGNDVLTGWQGWDIMNGGAGTDHADFSAATGSSLKVLYANGFQKAYRQPLNDLAAPHIDYDDVYTVEQFTGTRNNDSIHGTNGADSLFGGAGNDSVYGGDGNDTLSAGTTVDGSDVLSGGNGLDTADYSARVANLTLKADGTGGSGAVGENDFIFGEVETLVGGSGNDQLYGHTGNSRLDGRSGNDSMYGGDGNDTLAGGTAADGSDVLSGGNGLDTADYSNRTANLVLNATGGGGGGGATGENDYIFGEVETLIGGSGNDLITGHSGNSVLYGRGGSDTLNGGSGSDLLFGEDGDDWLYSDGDGAIDTLNGGNGTDRAKRDPGDIYSQIEILL